VTTQAVLDSLRNVRQRDGGLCVRGCGRLAKDVDHIVPLMDGGAPFDLANLQSLCRPCHNRKGAEGQSREWRRAPTHIWLIVGPPGADLLGKVRELRRHPSDLVIDSDLCARALFEGVTWSAELGREDALEAQMIRNRLITDLRRGVVPRFAVRCFLTSTNPQATRFLPNHEVIEVDPGLPAILLDVETGRLPAIFRELALRYYQSKVDATEGLAKRDRAELHIAADPLEAA
jgi:HNH endonuclease